jgi:NADPH:quinone reductase
MRAVVLREFGPPERLVVEELPDPRPGPGQAVVAVEIASITFVETQVRAGIPPNPAMLPPLPAVPGNGIGGTVVSVGADVALGLVGQRVLTTTGGSGGYAEQVAVSAAGLIAVPAGLGLADAVALLADGRTAVGLMDLAGIEAGDAVLIEAAAGGVGSLLVQLATYAGATVVGAAGGRRKTAIAHQLGATVAVDYTEPGWTEQVRSEVDAIDVVFDGVGGHIGTSSFGLLAERGRFVLYGMASGAFTLIPEEARAAPRISVLRSPPRDNLELNDLTRRALGIALSDGLQPVIGQTFPLDRADDAHAAIEARATTGKTLLLPRADHTPDHWIGTAMSTRRSALITSAKAGQGVGPVTTPRRSREWET